MSGMDMSLPPPFMGQIIHRELRRLTGVEDPYLEAKQRFNRLAGQRLDALRRQVAGAADPLALAARIAIAGNIIDFGLNGSLTEAQVHQALDQALTQSLLGDWDGFSAAMTNAQRILYLADNAGEIFFDRLLIEQLPMDRVTLAVRGKPILNDATRDDARAAGLHELVHVIDNGSDAPGTILADCSGEFIQAFFSADMIIAKGQGNFETLSDEIAPLFFLFKAKCPVIAAHAGVEQGSLVVQRSARFFNRASPARA
jgi:uncharacterized protein with ATP-grasp and redox domains